MVLIKRRIIGGLALLGLLVAGACPSPTRAAPKRSGSSSKADQPAWKKAFERRFVAVPVADINGMGGEELTRLSSAIAETFDATDVKKYRIERSKHGLRILVPKDRVEGASAAIEQAFADGQLDIRALVSRDPAATDTLLAFQLKGELLDERDTLVHAAVWQSLITTMQQDCNVEVGSEEASSGGRARSATTQFSYSDLKEPYKGYTSRDRLSLQFRDRSLDDDEVEVGTELVLVLTHDVWIRRKASTKWKRVSNASQAITSRRANGKGLGAIGCLDKLRASVLED